MVNQQRISSVMSHILVLGGTLEASALARALARRKVRATLSFAGRVADLKPQLLPVRVGGFGGVVGLVRHLRDNAITHLIDATHPFAAQMSAHAVEAAQRTGIPLLALVRPPWQPQAGDLWQTVTDFPAAVAALAGPPRRIMLALGRLQLPLFAAQPQHHYLLRLIDSPTEPLPFPRCTVLIDRGPFHADADTALLQQHGIQQIVCKNAGGQGAEAKLVAARRLGIPVLMIDRPVIPPRHAVGSVNAVLDWLGLDVRKQEQVSHQDTDLGV